MRTLSATRTTPDGTDDLDNQVVDSLESLRQRIAQRLRFPAGTWELDTRQGTPSVLGYTFTLQLAASVLTRAIQDEGGDEVTGVEVRVSYVRGTRTMVYHAEVASIYGPMTMEGEAV